MGKAKPPAMQFYVRDWHIDTDGLTVAAKGAWISILCKLHLAKKRGKMTRTPAAWARTCGTTVEEVMELLKELNCEKCANVTFCHTQVTVMSRRMDRERKEKEGNALRKRRERVSRSCHKKVTPPSASAK